MSKSREEIEILCKELDAADSIGKAHTVAIRAFRLCEARDAEVAELVEALQRIADDGPWRPDWSHQDASVIAGNALSKHHLAKHQKAESR